MERQQELRALLKRWEAQFLRERRRKPRQADIEEAPEETRELYKEYRRLKNPGKPSDSSGKPESQEIPNVPQVEDSGFWGSHLNRAPKILGKLPSRSPRAGISVEYYGMKLKAKVGTMGKEPPLTPRRTSNPRKTPKIPQKSLKNPEPGGETSPSEPPENEEKPQNPAEKSQNLEEKSQNPEEKSPNPKENPENPKEKPQNPAEKSPNPEEKSQNPEEKSPNPEEKSQNPAGKPQNPVEKPQNSKKKPQNLMEKSPNPEEEPRNSEKNPPNPEEFPEFFPAFPPFPDKFRLLRQKVAQTLGSLDPGWLQRCQESPKKRELPILPRENVEKIPESVGNSGRKRRREGENAAEAPAKLGRRFPASNPGIFGIREFQEEKEEEESRDGAEEAAEGSEKILEKEEKRKTARKTRAAPLDGGNFVRLNLKRKTFSRASLRGKFLRKQVWKQKWRKKFGPAADLCFRCGGKGHWASECPEKDSGALAEKIPAEELLTLEEVARRTKSGLGPEIPGGGFDMANSQDFPQPEFSPPPPPLYPPNADGTIPDPPEEVLEALRLLGYKSFRPGQAEAVMRVLAGISTLVTLPTGTGKSLCYQLPAFLYHRNSGSICLVVSPLVSLMDDQVSRLPSALKAVCVHSNLAPSQRKAAVDKIKSGRAQILLLSPECVVGAGAFSPFFRDFPPVAFACLDEVHCISQWSHNFRPAYLRVCKVLRERLGVRCFLGLTATATVATARDVAKHLGIPAENGLGIGHAGIPENLRLSVSMDSDRDQALLWLLGPGPLGSERSVLVYCGRREESQRLAALVRRNLPDVPSPAKSGNKPRKGRPREFRVSAAYHAGLSPRERRQIQRDFTANGIRVLCATISFGMGLDKGDVGAVVHYDPPGSIEGFVQEVGRAGRDGAPARCHLFLDSEGQDLLELRRHIHENSVDFLAVKTLIQRVFAPCKCLEKPGKNPENSQETSEFPKNPRICRGHQRAVPVRELVEALDLREEGIETLLCLLELHPQPLLELFPSVHSRARIQIPRNFPPELLRDTALRCPPLAFLLAREFPAGIPGIPGIPAPLEFDAVALSDSLGCEFRALRQSLQKAGSGSGLRVEFREFSFYFRSFGDLSPRELDSVCGFLHSQVLSREKSELGRLRRCFQTFRSVAAPSCVPPGPEGPEQNRRLRERLREHFTEEPREEPEHEEEEAAAMSPEQEAEIRAQIREFLAAYPDEEFSGRAVARIFHGIGSPRFPARDFGRDRRFWRRLLPTEFRSLARLAAQEILAWR